jgi:preprotein translocase subunit SecE
MLKSIFNFCFIFRDFFDKENIQSAVMNKVSTYIRESYHELLDKVTWPTWAQLQQSTVIVLVATVLITAMVWVMDFASNSLLKFVYQLFK